jgi:hypothetical protein
MNGGITTPFDLMLPIDRFAEISSHPAGRLATSSATVAAILVSCPRPIIGCHTTENAIHVGKVQTLLVPTLEPRLQVADAERDQRQQNASEDVQQSAHNLSVAYALQLARCTGSAAALPKTTSCSVINTGAVEISASSPTPSGRVRAAVHVAAVTPLSTLPRRIISMMIGVACSRGEVSMRISPSIGSVPPRWALTSSSAMMDPLPPGSGSAFAGVFVRVVRYLFSAQALRGLPTLLRLGVVRGPTVSCG